MRPRGHVLREAGVDAHQTDIADGGVVERSDAGSGVVFGAEVAIPQWDLGRHPPAAVDHVLAPEGPEVGADLLVVVVRRRRGAIATPVPVLVHEVVFDEHRAAGLIRQQRSGADAEDVTAASAGASGAGRQNGGQTGGRRQRRKDRTCHWVLSQGSAAARGGMRAVSSGEAAGRSLGWRRRAGQTWSAHQRRRDGVAGQSPAGQRACEADRRWRASEEAMAGVGARRVRPLTVSRRLVPTEVGRGRTMAGADHQRDSPGGRGHHARGDQHLENDGEHGQEEQRAPSARPRSFPRPCHFAELILPPRRSVPRQIRRAIDEVPAPRFPYFPPPFTKRRSNGP